MTAAEGDPLRAQELENEVSQYWWERWLVYREEQAKAQKKKAERKHG
jgi:hypothetical protein